MSDGVGVSHDGGDALSSFRQDHVAYLVANLFVDDVEIVQVNVEQRYPALFPGRPGQSLV